MPYALSDVTFGAATIKQITDGALNDDAQVIVKSYSGDLDPSAFFGGAADPRWTGTSQDVAGVLAAIDEAQGLSVASGSIIVPYQNRVTSGFDSSATHMRFTAANGFIYPTRAQVRQQSGGGGEGDGSDDATVDLESVILSTDGFTNPITSAGSQAATTQAFNAAYGLGIVGLDGTEVEGVTGFTVDFGIEIRVKRYKGATYPTAVYVVRRRPAIEIEFEDVSELATYANVTALSSCAALMRKRSGTGYVSTATAEHIKFSFGTAMSARRGVRASGNDDARPVLRVSGAALTVSTTSTLSL